MQGLIPRPGEIVWIRRRRWRVERARRFERQWRLDVAGCGRAITFIAPFDRPVSAAQRERPRVLRRRHALARLADLVRRRRTLASLDAAVDADAMILPHQLEPALAMLRGARRVLVADEVGLGKTVQAGLVIAELHRRRIGARILVIAPAGLRTQWLAELRQRFRLESAIADAHGIAAAAQSAAADDNPWRRPGIWIASLDYLKQHHVLAALPAEPWDLVVIDEAHGVCGESDRHDAAAAIAERARRVLLLTATPHNGDAARFSRLMELGRLAAVDDPLAVFRRTRRELGMRLSRRIRWHDVRLSNTETRAIDELHRFERAVLRAAGTDRADAAHLLLSVFRKRALSTMAALATSLERRRQWLDQTAGPDAIAWRQPALDFEDAWDLVGEEERPSLSADVGLAAADERAWLERLHRLAEAAAMDESKVERLARLLRRSSEPVAVFTEFRDSLDVVHERIARVRPVAVLHGGQSPGDQQRELGRFLDGAASVLLATDVAGQGLNLQSRARWVVNLELPWNPGRLEQRAGRVDRIGQARSVHVTLLVARHPCESGLLAHLLRRTLTARRALGDDTLVGAVPSDSQIRAHLLADQPLPEPGPPARVVTLCRAFVRPAHAEARALLGRRALAAFWRAPSPDASRPGVARATRSPALRALTSGSLLVLSVPLTNRAGDVLEKHIVAIRIDGDWRTAPNRAAITDRARACATGRLLPRQRRLVRTLRAARDRSSAFEAAISATLEGRLGPRVAQVGLFDRRELRRVEAMSHAIDDLRAATRSRLEELDLECHVEIGRPVLELVFTAVS